MKALADRMNNFKVKAQFVLDNTEEVRKQIKITSGNLMLINLAKRDGLKCDCCGDDKLFFTVHPENGLVLVSNQIFKKRPMAMTMDHDTLKSLSGADTIENQHLLCERCNTARGNSFAEYAEFKDWFKEQQSFGRNPYNAATSLVQNFCYMDFDKNLGSLKSIEHLAKGAVFPPVIRNYLIKNYMTNGKFVRAVPGKKEAAYTNETVLTRYNTDAWNDVLNTILAKLVVKHDKYTIDTPKVNFAVYKTYKKSKMGSEQFLEMIHNKMQSTYFEYHTNVVPQIRRENIRKHNLESTQRQSVEMQKIVQEQHFVVVPADLSWWQKVLNVVKAMIS